MATIQCTGLQGSLTEEIGFVLDTLVTGKVNGVGDSVHLR